MLAETAEDKTSGKRAELLYGLLAKSCWSTLTLQETLLDEIDDPEEHEKDRLCEGLLNRRNLLEEDFIAAGRYCSCCRTSTRACASADAFADSEEFTKDLFRHEVSVAVGSGCFSRNCPGRRVWKINDHVTSRLRDRMGFTTMSVARLKIPQVCCRSERALQCALPIF